MRPEINPILVETNGVIELLQSLNVHKACGPDGIPANLLKEACKEIAPSLSFIFQASLQQCTLPLDWKRANIVPLFKKGDRSTPSNYRPVSLTCICSKLLEHIVYSHVYAHLTKYNVLCDQQHGFRQGRSCETQLLLTVNDFAENLNKNDQTDVILLDFSKAFDKVSHHHLFHKLNHYGIRGDLLNWIKHFTLQRSQCVVVEGQQSGSAAVTSGVPQGTVLAPLLFLCFINDLPKGILSKIKLYADDVLLYNTIHTQQDCQQLQKDLDLLGNWAAKWKMVFNPQKCEFIRITKKKHPTLNKYYIQNKEIKEVTHAKYLGITLSHNLSWSEHIKKITNKANKTKGFLQRNLHKCPLTTKSNCYKAMVKPILEYASVIWSPHTQKDINMIERCQRQAARFVMNNYSSYASVTQMLNTLNWPTLAKCRQQERAIMMFKIIHNLVDIPANYYLTPLPMTHDTRGHNMRLLQPMTRTDSYLYSFFPSAIKIWNSLPQSVIDSNDIDQFKQRLAGLETII